MAIHRVLIQRNEDVKFVTETKSRLVAGSESQEDVASANDRLVGVVCVQVKATAGGYAGQNISGSRYPLTRSAADSNRKINLSHDYPPGNDRKRVGSISFP